MTERFRFRRVLSSASRAVLCALLVSMSAAARDRDPIVLATSDGTSTTSRRLEAELRSLGLEVIITIVPASDGESRAAIERAARAANAMAAVYVVAHGTKAELWIVDRVTNKTTVREIMTTDQTRDGADDAIAVGVAELLRASLLEIDTRKPPAGEYPTSPRIREMATRTEQPSPRDESGLWTDVGAGAVLGMRGVGSSFAALAAVGWRGVSGFGLEALGATSIATAGVERPEARATLATQWLGSAATLAWEPRGSIVSARAGLGIVAARVETRGEATPPLVADTAATWTVGPYLHAGPTFGPSFMRARLDFGVFVASKAVRIRFAGEPVATWGQPTVLVALNIEAAGAM
jgi:hypothetical protein